MFPNSLLASCAPWYGTLRLTQVPPAESSVVMSPFSDARTIRYIQPANHPSKSTASGKSRSTWLHGPVIGYWNGSDQRDGAGIGSTRQITIITTNHHHVGLRDIDGQLMRCCPFCFRLSFSSSSLSLLLSGKNRRERQTYWRSPRTASPSFFGMTSSFLWQSHGMFHIPSTIPENLNSCDSRFFCVIGFPSSW
jgi:hypothetical protein